MSRSDRMDDLSNDQTEDDARTDLPARPRRQAVRDFYDAFYNRKDFDAARPMLSVDFVNHHPGVPDGRESTIEQFRVRAAEPIPNLFIEITRIAVDDDLVWVHSLVSHGSGAVAGTLDVWRFEGELLAEHWDFGPLPLEQSQQF